jgi:hypothetical protein
MSNSINNKRKESQRDWEQLVKMEKSVTTLIKAGICHILNNKKMRITNKIMKRIMMTMNEAF